MEADDERVKLGATVPAPLSATVCGEPAALSATESVAAKLAMDPGVKVTEIVQLEPAAKDAPQLWVWLKSLRFVPAIVIPLMVSAALPVFTRVAA